MYRAFAREYHWTPQEVDALPVEFVEEQLVVWKAEADAERNEQRRVRRKGGK